MESWGIGIIRLPCVVPGSVEVVHESGMDFPDVPVVVVDAVVRLFKTRAAALGARPPRGRLGPSRILPRRGGLVAPAVGRRGAVSVRRSARRYPRKLKVS